ncbi:hypothetical protein IV203_015231 [Nitzschia inconspicua]|uniref:Uncharacterized protein n=1 Tax=Nitzschia inconspicua TaxID=303405 RepID=A0A9K3LAM1_9STRA|nr:hypothetical protein IV203_015231 [Nitzschia inconspicua]
MVVSLSEEKSLEEQRSRCDGSTLLGVDDILVKKMSGPSTLQSHFSLSSSSPSTLSTKEEKNERRQKLKIDTNIINDNDVSATWKARCDESRLDLEKIHLQRITTEGIPCSVFIFLSMKSPVSVQDSDDFVDPEEHRQTKAPDHFFCHIETYPAEDWDDDDDDDDAYSIFRANCSVFGMQSKQSIELPVQELRIPIHTQIGHDECSNQRRSFRFRRIFSSSKVETNIDVSSCYLGGVSDQRWKKLGMIDRLFCCKKKNVDDDISAVTFRIYSRAQL